MKKVIAIVAAIVVAGLAVWGGIALFNKSNVPATPVTTPTEIVEVIETPAPTVEVTPTSVG